TLSQETKLFLNDPNNPTGYSQVLEELTVSGTSTNVDRSYTIGDDILAQNTGSATQHLLYDGHGSTRLLTESGGNIASRFAFDAYGNTLGTAFNSTQSPATSLLYTGEQFDTDLAHYYLRAR